jgi:hypothetical protein
LPGNDHYATSRGDRRWSAIRYAAGVDGGGGTVDWRALNRANWDGFPEQGSMIFSV